MKVQEIDIYEHRGNLYYADYIPPDKQILKNLQLLIEKDFRKNRDVEMYAWKMNQSLNYLNKLTQAYLMETVYEVIQSRLLREASFLLKDTTLSVKEISYELGYCDPSYFCRWFRQRTGLSPGRFRKGLG